MINLDAMEDLIDDVLSYAERIDTIENLIEECPASLSLYHKRQELDSLYNFLDLAQLKLKNFLK
jgi:hypothetical protein